MLGCASKWSSLMGNRIHILGMFKHELTNEYTGVLPSTILSTLNMFEIFYSEEKKKIGWDKAVFRQKQTDKTPKQLRMITNGLSQKKFWRINFE